MERKQAMAMDGSTSIDTRRRRPNSLQPSSWRSGVGDTTLNEGTDSRGSQAGPACPKLLFNHWISLGTAARLR